MVPKVIRGCIGAAVLYGAERGAMNIWPDVTTALPWWGGAAVVVVLWVAVEVFLSRRWKARRLKAKLASQAKVVRLTEHSTSRPIGDGWNEVTTTRKVPPVRIAGIGTVEGGGSASLKPPADTDDERPQ